MVSTRVLSIAACASALILAAGSAHGQTGVPGTNQLFSNQLFGNMHERNLRDRMGLPQPGEEPLAGAYLPPPNAGERRFDIRVESPPGAREINVSPPVKAGGAGTSPRAP